MRLCTAGYSGRSPASLIEDFKKARVELVIDVRINPASRDPRWEREALGLAVEIAGMRYQWTRGLGNPFYPRGRSVSVQQGKEILSKCREHLLTNPGARGSLQWLAGLLEAQTPRPALLCLCPASSRCHRSVIVELLRTRLPALEVVDL